jgi:hypothetical protein
LFTRIKLYAYASLAVLAVALLAVSPAMAEAQGIAPTKNAQGADRDAADAVAPAEPVGVPERMSSDPPVAGDYEDAKRVVVSPGDSLWSISEERLGPNATAGQIAEGVERIYALNRHRIGGDPDQIFPGQELLVLAVDPAQSGPPRGAPAQSATKAAEKSAPKTAETSARDPAPETASKTPRDTKAEPVALPDLPTKEVMPEAGSLAAKGASPSPGVSSVRSAMAAIVDRAGAVAGSLPEVRHDEHKLLGLGFFAIAFAAALGLVFLAARPLRERRRARKRTWQQGYGKNYTYFDPLAGPENQPKPAEGEHGRSTEDAGMTRTDPPPAGDRPEVAEDPTPEGRTTEVVYPDGREAGSSQGGR